MIQPNGPMIHGQKLSGSQIWKKKIFIAYKSSSVVWMTPLSHTPTVKFYNNGYAMTSGW